MVESVVDLDKVLMENVSESFDIFLNSHVNKKYFTHVRKARILLICWI